MDLSPLRKVCSDNNIRPHIVRKTIGSMDRWYVYECRGGALVMKRDGERPTRDEAIFAVTEHLARTTSVAKAAARGKTAHRPLFLQELFRIGAQSDRWTYFIGDGAGAVKIGATKCVRSRLKILQPHNSRPLEVLAMVRGGELLESAYHAIFAADRINNEWFTLSLQIEQEVRYLRKIAREQRKPKTGSPDFALGALSLRGAA